VLELLSRYPSHNLLLTYGQEVKEFMGLVRAADIDINGSSSIPSSVDMKVEVLKTENQQNAVDCGVFVCSFMNELALNPNEVPKISMQSIAKMRETAAVEIYQGKLFQPYKKPF
jgi:hypothetical protein